ncbi:MAG: ABC transporter ATP-binding protein [Abyssibacter sp.]|uniref:ABC transporter ATP-binding protein n=1 Tax=Abyssibacter sp. TaxID=2320200 RepID=UPI0032199041
MTAVAGLSLQGLTVALGGRPVLYDVDLQVEAGEFVVLAGPSGSGKSTLLRAIAGLVPTGSGRIAAGGVDFDGLAPGQREVALVFQDHALLPHLSVAENLAFGLRARRVPRGEARRRAMDVAERLGLGGLLDRPAVQLSGGERQRVALGRAMLRDARLVLMDEPLSSLDAPLRARMRQEILELHRRQGWTTVYVTHDQAEALSMADRLGVLVHGRLQQFDHPQTLYAEPASTTVAAFLGNPAMQLLPARQSGGQTWLLGGEFPRGPSGTPPETLLAGVRAEQLHVSGSRWVPPIAGDWRVTGEIQRIEHLGDVQWLHVRVGDEAVIVRVEPDTLFANGAGVELGLAGDAVRWFDAATGLAL